MKKQKQMPSSTICPKCGHNKLDERPGRNALSREDNKTMICSDCGTIEALESMNKK